MPEDRTQLERSNDRTYEAPAVRPIGSVAELSQGNEGGSAVDLDPS